MKRSVFIVLLGAMLLYCGLQGVAATTYSAQALGIASGFTGSLGTDINDNGVAVIASMSAEDTSGCSLWSHNDGFVDLSGNGVLVFSGINNQGQTAGMYWVGPGCYSPYIRNSDGTTRQLSLPDGVATGNPVKILNSGQVAVNTTYPYTQVVTTPEIVILGGIGDPTFVDYPAGYDGQLIISDNGKIVMSGYMWTEAEGLRALPWITTDTTVRAVNDLGWIVGTSNGHVLRWDASGNMADLGLGEASDINNLGQVVGSINERAVIWNADNTIVELPLLGGYAYTYAYAINNLGQVVGEGMSEDNQHMALLWEQTPEPSSLLALAGGLISMGGLTLRRRAK